MLKRSLLTAMFAIVLISSTAYAQNLCPNGAQSDKLVCLIPQVYGANGLTLGNPVPLGHFQDNFLGSSLSPLNSATARQVALLPLASPSSGITFSWDPVARAFTSSTDSYGPIFGERAETIGRHRVFIGFGYQYLRFDSIDGIDLKKLPSVFPQQDDSTDGPSSFPTCSVSPRDTPSNMGGCGFIRDVIKTTNRLDLKIHQFTTFFTFGLTNRIDVSVAIPIENIRMGIFSDAAIVNNSQSRVHIFPGRPECPSGCLTSPFSNVRNVSGIGDMTLRVKGTAWKGERAALALGVDVRLPTGDQLNFLGAGAAGVKPFVVWSYRSRISPHALAGYEANGSSVIAGDISTGKKDRIPSQFAYAAGADVWLTKRFTAAFDIVGQQVFEARRATVTSFTELGGCKDSSCGCTNPNDPTTCNVDSNFKQANTDFMASQVTASYNATNASVGVKVRPFSALLITGNALFKLNEGGLRARIAPFVGISYTF